MSIPHNIFQIIHIHRGKRVTWWKSAREECIAMARTVPLMACPLNTRIHNTTFATDAQGMGEGDLGGYGVVGSVASTSDIDNILRQGELPGLTVRRAGQFEGMRNASVLRPTVSVTRIDHSIFLQERWKTLIQGRWRKGNHITLGECRAVLKLLKRLAVFPEAHNSMVISIQDNMATACSMKKGRSPSFPILRILRQRQQPPLHVDSSYFCHGVNRSCSQQT